MTEMSQADTAFTQAKGSGNTVYEVGFHVVPTVEESQVPAMADRIRAAITKMGGSILAEEAPKRMTLAYRVERSVAGKREKYTESYFGWMKFEVESGAAMPELEAMLRADSSILRSLVIHTTRETTTAPREIFSSNRLEGSTIKKQTDTEEKGEVSEEELNKTLESIVA